MFIGTYMLGSKKVQEIQQKNSDIYVDDTCYNQKYD